MNVAAVSALIFAGLIDRSTVTSEEALRLTNVTIQLVRGSRNWDRGSDIQPERICCFQRACQL
jgi:hypothetical protein